MRPALVLLLALVLLQLNPAMAASGGDPGRQWQADQDGLRDELLGVGWASYRFAPLPEDAEFSFEVAGVGARAMSVYFVADDGTVILAFEAQSMPNGTGARLAFDQQTQSLVLRPDDGTGLVMVSSHGEPCYGSVGLSFDETGNSTAIETDGDCLRGRPLRVLAYAAGEALEKRSFVVSSASPVDALERLVGETVVAQRSEAFQGSPHLRVQVTPHHLDHRILHAGADAVFDMNVQAQLWGSFAATEEIFIGELGHAELASARADRGDEARACPCFFTGGEDTPGPWRFTVQNAGSQYGLFVLTVADARLPP